MKLLINNQVRTLIKRRDELARKAEKNNKKQISDLQQLQKLQTELTRQLKEQILAGEDYTQTVTELREVSAKLLSVNEKFKELTDSLTESITFQKNSLARLQ